MPKPRSHARALARALAVGILVLAFLAGGTGPSEAGHRRPREDRVTSALRAARDAIGSPYRYGGSSPSGGFDCSGLTMWAWRHGDVRLPHSSRQQYEVLPHLKRRQLKPGDLLFFYRPISHVAMFVGHNRMIEAGHSGTRVRRTVVYWRSYSGAARAP